MRDRKHMHVLIVVREEHDVRKSMNEDLLIRAARTPQRRAMRTFDEGFERAIDLRNEFFSESRLLVRIPVGGCSQFELRRSADDDPSHLERRPLKMRARTVAQSSDLLGSSCERRSSSASQAASHSASFVPSTLSINSDASASRSCAGSCNASARSPRGGCELTRGNVARSSKGGHSRVLAAQLWAATDDQPRGIVSSSACVLTALDDQPRAARGAAR